MRGPTLRLAQDLHEQMFVQAMLKRPLIFAAFFRKSTRQGHIHAKKYRAKNPVGGGARVNFVTDNRSKN